MFSLIGKHVMEAEQALSYRNKEDNTIASSLINVMLLGDEKMTAEDIATVLLDMLLIGVNTVSSLFCITIIRGHKLHHHHPESSSPSG
ncbi:Uncharacterized protein OBRU01_10196 [Operophtera brumata]|uniref:Cytochrome P450 n=1 Tax=Operophtera brumata TaxID=104452 RepID=A0A0L7L5J5_OPEBR|nr:Uncharacterized protein OBRU01_10196 [Operophtera brumata]